MRQTKMNTWFSLQFNPFIPDIPWENLWYPPEVDMFIKRVLMLVDTGGFALITGEPGCGKSAALRVLKGNLENLPDIRVAVLTRPQSNMPDLYRELGEIFKIPISPFNRWNGFNKLRDEWKEHISSTLCRPVLLLDEAQLMPAKTLNELRLLSSLELDSKNALTIVLAGDKRLTESFKKDDLLPLGTRIRTRLDIEKQSPENLVAFLDHLLRKAGNPSLFSEKLKQILADVSAGNYRVLTTLASEILSNAMLKEIVNPDESLYYELFSSTRKLKVSKN